MLLKKLITYYGQSLTGVLRDHDATFDVLKHRGTAESLTSMMSCRRQILDSLMNCKPFFLDHHAADMVDSLVRDLDREGEDFARDIDLPHDVVWIEFDEAALLASRKARFDEAVGYAEGNYQMKGVLFDSRNPAFLRSIMFRDLRQGYILDPVSEVRIHRDAHGKLSTAHFENIPFQHMAELMEIGPGISRERFLRAMESDSKPCRKAILFSYAFFSLLSSRPEDVLIGEDAIFSDAERKTARKFGKSHILSAPRSHNTISLTDPAKRYLAQMREDAEDRRNGITTPRVRHEVREHERRYKSGLVITIAKHHRGSKPDLRPTRIVATPETEPDDMPAPM